MMAPLIIIVGTSNCLGSQYYTPSGQRKRSAKVIVLGAVVNLVLNLLLIPWIGAYGATAASVIAECVITIIYVNMSNGYMKWGKLLGFAKKRLPAGAAMGALVYACGEMLKPLSAAEGTKFGWAGLLTLLLQIMTGVASYVLFLTLLKDGMMKELIQTGRNRLHMIIKRK